MAAVAELSFLLIVFISRVQAEELLTILEEKGFYTFKLPEEADLISRCVGEQKVVLWNTSEPWSKNITVPDMEALKDQRSLVDRVNISSNTIHNLTPDSGLYQVECWTVGYMTLEKNISVAVCSRQHEISGVDGGFGSTVDLQCEGAADNLTIQWLQHNSIVGGEEIWR